MQELLSGQEQALQQVLRDILLSMRDGDHHYTLKHRGRGICYEVIETHFLQSSAPITVILICPDSEDPITVIAVEAGWITEDEAMERVARWITCTGQEIKKVKQA